MFNLMNRRGYNQANVVYTVIKVDTTKTTTGGSDSQSIRLPMINFAGSVDFGDGTVNEYSFSASSVITHSYAVSGVYEIKIRIIDGNYAQFFYNYGSINDRNKLIEIVRWGKLYIGSSSFYGCENLKLSNVLGFPLFTNNPTNAFRSCTSLNFINGLNLWDFSNVISANFMFVNATAFNQDLSVLTFNKNIDLSNFMIGKSSANYSASNYSKLLIKVRDCVVGTGRTQTVKYLTMQNIKYDSAGASARADLIADGWIITDGGMI